LDPKAKPKTIDLTVDCKTIKGIYEFSKNTLKVCAGADENAPRPKDFKAEETNLLIVFKRATGEKKEKDKGKEEKGKGDKGAGAAVDEVRLAPPAAEAAAECAQEGALKTASANNLKMIGIAMHNFLDANRGSFPAAAIYSKDGKALLSWRVAILPYL